MCNSRAAYIVQKTKLILELTFFFAKVPFFLDPCLDKDCLQLVALFEIMLRRERYCVKIIRSIVKLINAMLLDTLFTTYNYESHLY